MRKLIGIDIGGTNVRFGIVQDNRVIAETRLQADFANICKSLPSEQAWQTIIQLIAEHIRQCLQLHPEIQAVGIGFPGFIDARTGKLAQSPNLPGLFDVDLASDLSKVISMPVIVENDASAAAYGEFKLFPNVVNSLVYIGLGTGVGGGLVHQGYLFAGEHGMAMEVGHTIVEPDGRLCGCGNLGCLERYASASGVSFSYQQSTRQQLSAQEIAQLAEAGDEAALEAYWLAGKTLAQALAHIVKVLDVENVTIGGGMSLAWPLMEAAFNQRLQADLIPVLRDKVRIHISQTGDHAGIIGAALLAEKQV